MIAAEIIEKVKALQLPEDTYVVFGSCPLALANLREANDIDMLVSEDLYQELEAKGWKPFKNHRRTFQLFLRTLRYAHTGILVHINQHSPIY